MIRLRPESRMWDIRFPGFNLKSSFYYINGPHKQSAQIDMDPIYKFYFGLPGIRLYKSVKHCRYVAPACWRNIPAIFRTLQRHIPGSPKQKM